MAGPFLRVGVTLAAAALAAAAARADTHSPFALVAPAVRVDARDHARLQAGDAVVKVLPRRGRELAVFAAVRVDAPPERLVDWGRRVDRLTGRYVAAAGRFSAPPQPGDVDAVALGDEDLQDLRRCRPGDCSLKLNDAEIAALRDGVTDAADWKEVLQRGFRDALTARARAADASFEHAGFAGWEPVDSFLYWSVETYGFKPITSVTQLRVLRRRAPDAPAALVVSRQLFATHYKDAAVGMTAITGSAEDGWYLTYVHHSEVDVLDGMFGGVVRRVVERRVRDEAPALLLALRRTLEAR
jgi:hypothetical protein